MITFDVVQGTSEWAALRIGIPTASAFDNILTEKKLELSAKATAYAHRLIAEEHMGVALDDATSTSMHRGQVLERKAVEFYELRRELDTVPIGFVMRDDRRVGCSPDRFVGTDGLLEIKSPEPHTHVGYLLDEKGIGYRLQVQGQLWLCEREWSDTLSYHPDFPPALVRQHRDEAVIEKLKAGVNQFLEHMYELKLQLQKHGLFTDLTAPGDLRVVA